MNPRDELTFLDLLVADAFRFGELAIECPTVVDAADQVWRLQGEKVTEHQRAYTLIYLSVAKFAWNVTP